MRLQLGRLFGNLAGENTMPNGESEPPDLRMSKSLLIYTDPRYGKRTYATAMQLTFGNCAGIMAPL